MVERKLLKILHADYLPMTTSIRSEFPPCVDTACQNRHSISALQQRCCCQKLRIFVVKAEMLADYLII